MSNRLTIESNLIATAFSKWCGRCGAFDFASLAQRCYNAPPASKFEFLAFEAHAHVVGAGDGCRSAEKSGGGQI